MQWIVPPVRAIFLKRYKRFFSDLEIDNKVEVAHVANTGSLKSCLREGAPALALPSQNPERKLKWTLVALGAQAGGWIGVDTSVPNRLLPEVFEQKQDLTWSEFSILKTEVKISKETRLDGLLCDQAQLRKRYLEVKNVTLATGNFLEGRGVARFPDAVTERGQKHLRELIALVQAGHEAELIFAIQRQDCAWFAPATEIDPIYSQLFYEAQAAGVLISPWVIEVSERGARWTGQKLPIQS